MASATSTIPHSMSSACTTSKSAAIFGVSFKPRAKLTTPALTKCPVSMARWQLIPRKAPA
jgi:hypothetical protein